MANIIFEDFVKTQEFTDAQTAKFRDTAPISTNYTIDPATDETLVVVAQTSDITITLPTLASLAGHPYRVVEIVPVVKNGYKIRIACQTGDEFPFGNTWFDLPRQQKEFEIGLANHGFNLRRNIAVSAHYHRNATWSASNFSSMTAIPFDEEGHNTQDQMIVWNNSERVTVETSGSYYVSYGLDIDSTGGNTWNVIAQIYKNGVAVPHSDVRTGNYGGEDQSMSLIEMKIDMDAGDYLEVRLDQNNLTGNLVGATFNVSIVL